MYALSRSRGLCLKHWLQGTLKMDGAIIVVAATDGPMPINLRAHLAWLVRLVCTSLVEAHEQSGIWLMILNY